MALGLSVTMVAAFFTGAAAWAAPGPARGLAFGLTGVALLAVGFTRRRRAGIVQVRVTPEADILIRSGDTSDPGNAQVLFVSSWLIVLKHGSGVVPIWSDRLGRIEFRHLTVACRWRRSGA